MYVAAVTTHTFYLYTHREFGPRDFHHPLISTRMPSVANAADKQQAEKILKQKFVYLSYGGQMTVYESEDGLYVLKFFNPRSVLKEDWFHRWPKLMRINSWKWISNTYLHQKERLEKYFHRTAMSYNDLKDEAGLIYIHIDPGTSIDQTVELQDKEGTTHHFKLDSTPFVLQRKVELTRPYLDRMRHEGRLKEAGKKIYSLFLIRAQKGYKDPFQAVAKNFGFIDEKFVQFDTGRIRKDETVLKHPDQEVKRVLNNIKPLLTDYPELISEIDKIATSPTETSNL